MQHSGLSNKKSLVRLLKGIMKPSFIGIIINHYRLFFRCSIGMPMIAHDSSERKKTLFFRRGEEEKD